MNKKVISVIFILLSYSAMAQEKLDKLSEAQLALKELNYTKAYELYRQVINESNDAMTGGYYFNAALAAQRAENYDAAVSWYDEAINANSNVQRSIYGKCECLVALGFYTEAVEIDPQNAARWRYKAAVQCYSNGVYDLAASLFELVVAENYNTENAIVYQYNSLINATRVSEAEDLITNQVANFPDSKITKLMANLLLQDATMSYQQGIMILSQIKRKNTNGGSTREKGYASTMKSAKSMFKEALIDAEEAKKYDSSNQEIQVLIDACKLKMK